MVALSQRFISINIIATYIVKLFKVHICISDKYVNRRYTILPFSLIFRYRRIVSIRDKIIRHTV